MKKIILLTLLAMSALPHISWAANFSSISCSDSRISANSAGCNECFNAGALYYRSDRAIENVTNFYDTFSVTGTGYRVMWQDETSVTWGLLNNRFILGSSLSSTRSSANGFKFQTIPGSWQTAQNAPNTGRIYGLFAAGTSTVYVQSPGGISLDGVSSNITPADRSTAMWKISFNAASHNYISAGQQGPLVNHNQCAFLFGNWCGDGVIDTGKGEQCDDGNMNSGDGCSSTCQTEVTPVCNNLTVTPTSVTNGGTITYTCNGTNTTSYSIIARRPDGTTLTSSTSAAGSIVLPATPTGTYTVSCYVNGQVSTPSACQKTVTNTTVNEPVCTDLSITPTSVTNGGNVTYTCSGNNVSSYSVVFAKPDGTVLQSLTTQNGTVTIPATPTGTYTAKCYVNGQVSTPSACQKTVTNTTVNNPTCDNLSVNTSGTTVNYSCSGSGGINNYSIYQNGSLINNTASGSVNVGYGTYTFACYVNNSITSSSCQKTVTITPNQTYPQIQVVKDDNDNHDDSQFLQNGESAQFTIVVRNPGPEPIDNVVLSDVYAPECNRGSFETQNMIVNVGNRDARLDPGESFSYLCIKTNATQATFPNNENRICVNGRGVTSGIAVNSCDTTRIGFGTPTSVCQNIQVTQNGSQTNVYCSPNGGYKLYVLQGKQVINMLQSPVGQFNFGLNDGTYKVVCLKDGEQTVQPSCQKTITINPQQNYCTLESTVRFGGAPLRTQLNCSTPTFAQCAIRIMKDGKPWRSVADCNADIIFTEKGVYDATCVVGDAEVQSCSTRVQVDIMTIIRTGPFLPIILVLAIGMATYITYRRRKTV